ncbi:GNAT family N-acetyltransferase [Undibacterium sp. Di24W]|uniref:GNAT family N-acetyltransferase n=1 Tax=Undibacterium sp. Di24W TaxID=3413033 RepID=UPI003BF2009B
MNQKLTDGRALLRVIKASAACNQLSLVLPVDSPVRAYLRPIATAEGQLDETDLVLLSDWRNKYVKSFLTEFHANPARTAEWLTKFVHQNDGKILFMLEDLKGGRLGHIGLAFIDWDNSYGEADAIVSGGNSPPGLMKIALQASLRWAREQLGLKKLGVRVRSDNSALEFYKKVGFCEIKRVPLGFTQDGDDITWFEDESLGSDVPSLVYMIYEGK